LINLYHVTKSNYPGLEEDRRYLCPHVYQLVKMQHRSMATFHPFPRLPLELRMQIWTQAVTHERVVKVRACTGGARAYWSPTPAPAVTRACQESRKCCSYQPAFKVAESPRHIWTCFESDIIQLESRLIESFVKREDSLEKTEIRHLRLEVLYNGDDNSKWFFHYHSYRIRTSLSPAMSWWTMGCINVAK
jgi:hypothetical protein